MNNMYNNYQEQAVANISAFLDEAEYSKRKMEFLRIFKAFMDADIHFGVACSFNLFLRGMVDDFHDFDLIVDLKDFNTVKDIMEGLGAKKVREGTSDVFESDAFVNYELGRADFDIISGFGIVTFGTKYIYRYSSEEIEYVELYGENESFKVPLITLEALFILYGMMEGWQPKRKFKRILIQEALEEHMDFSNILKDAISNYDLPNWIKIHIRKLLAKE